MKKNRKKKKKKKRRRRRKKKKRKKKKRRRKRKKKKKRKKKRRKKKRKTKTLFNSKLDLDIRNKLEKCYIWSIVLCSAERWTLWEVLNAERLLKEYFAQRKD